MQERLLTEARVLWFYARMIIAPDISAMGLFHDDIAISRGLVEPWTTLPAVVALFIAAAAAITLRERRPLVSFAVLFFLAGHALESSVFPLELVYEHRNYLPIFGPLFALAFVPTVATGSIPISRPLLFALLAAMLLSLATVTALRADDWSGFGRLIVTEVDNHPKSLRSNFQYAQLLMEQLDDPQLRDEAARLAHEHFERIGKLDPENVNGLFGLILLNLQLGRQPPLEVVEELTARLRYIPFNPLNINVAHFPFLIKWHDNPRAPARLPAEKIL
jgi:hypothetical protein